jgi:AraC-like DNA-binding protein
MLSAGWNAHRLNAPGKFLISAPEHDIPKRARAYLVTDQAVSETSARHAGLRPGLDEISRNAILTGNQRLPESGNLPGAERDTARSQDALWLALCAAPDEGWDIGDLINFTGMSRATIYRHLREHISQGRVIQVARGRWRARTTPEPSP